MGTGTVRRFTKRFFAIANVFVALLFIVSCYGWWFNPLHFWYIGLITLGAFYLLVLLLFFILFWIFANFKYSLISIVAILICWMPIGELIGLNANKKFNLEKTASAIRVMSWNVEHFDIVRAKTDRTVKNEMLQTINTYAPDVACFQEMVASDKFPKAIHYLPKIIEVLNMPYVHYSFNKNLDFDGDHHFGIITLSKYPIISVHTLSYTPNDYNSIFQYVDIVKNEDTVRVFNTHLQSLKFTKENLQYIEDPEQEAVDSAIGQSKNIAAKFKSGFIKRKWQSERLAIAIAKSPYPVVVCGDFNDVPNSYAYHTIGHNLQNSFAEKGSGMGRTFANISPTLRIDNIFADKQFSVTQYTRVKRKMCDHFPIITDLVLKRN